MKTYNKGRQCLEITILVMIPIVIYKALEYFFNSKTEFSFQQRATCSVTVALLKNKILKKTLRCVTQALLAL